MCRHTYLIFYKFRLLLVITPGCRNVYVVIEEVPEAHLSLRKLVVNEGRNLLEDKTVDKVDGLPNF